MKKIVVAVVVALAAAAVVLGLYSADRAPTHVMALAYQRDRVLELPGFGPVAQLQMAGHLPVHAGADAYEDDLNLFYWFVGSEGEVSQAPIVLWLNGGPGWSGLSGFFAENGPYAIQGDRLLARPFSWSKRTSYLVIEQAPSVGFSYMKPGVHLANEAQAMELLHQALEQFFVRYPELAKNPLYLAGQSYAGKFLPQVATRMLEQQPQLNLKGILVGDGWVNPRVQQSANADYAYAHGLIDLTTYKQIQALYKECAQEIEKASSVKANHTCTEMQKLIRQKSGLSTLDIRASTEPDFSPISRYMDRADVRKALHVDPRVGEMAIYSQRVADDLEADIQDSAAHLYPHLLASGVRILLYNGLDDGTDSNFMGTDRWLAELDWPGKEAFGAAPTCIWRCEAGNVAGYVRTAMGLTQVKIRGAGHLAPMDQSAHTQDMLHRFVFEQDPCN